MNRFSRIGITVVTLAGLSLGTACTEISSSPPPATQAAHASWTTSYNNLEEVLKDTTLVAIGFATGQEKIASLSDGTGPKDTTLTTPRVTRSFGEDVEQVQVRSSDGFEVEEAVQYVVGQEYLVFLKPFEFEKGKPTGTFIAVGQLAAYAVNGEGAMRVTSRDSLVRRTSLTSLLESAAKVR